MAWSLDSFEIDTRDLTETTITQVHSTRTGSVISRWCSTLSTIDVLPFNQPVGPVHILTRDKNEKDFFHLIFPDNTYQYLADQTNLYAWKCRDVKPDTKWTAVTADKIQAFIGLHILMSVIPLPAYKDYWTRDNLCEIPAFTKIMTRLRFKKILQYFHCNDVENPPRGDPVHDPIHHVRPIFDVVQQNLHDNYNLHKSVSVDEARIPFRGCLSFRQYLPAKPCKFGIKVWELPDSYNGYVYKMQMYTGRSENGTREERLASRVVKDLTRCLVGKNHHVYMDNFCTSPELFVKLSADNICVTGTCRVNRKGFCQHMLIPLKWWK
ncbi:piggyBac transposable element-derived protein 4-like [Liolophura sinensis]|uniref:piggyBac transposable element-derived protein 4-like n=1 Tax=Liolophura sinensis TaxID=3198878 RepID=UPI00315805D6